MAGLPLSAPLHSRLALMHTVDQLAGRRERLDASWRHRHLGVRLALRLVHSKWKPSPLHKLNTADIRPHHEAAHSSLGVASKTPPHSWHSVVIRSYSPAARRATSLESLAGMRRRITGRALDQDSPHRPAHGQPEVGTSVRTLKPCTYVIRTSPLGILVGSSSAGSDRSTSKRWLMCHHCC